MSETDQGPRDARDRTFDNEAFFAALDAERVSRGIHWKAVASQAGVSASTLTRIGQGRRPDVDSLGALLSWAGLEPEQFFRGDKTDISGSSLPRISLLLRRDPHLSDDAAAALDELVKATYIRLRREL